ncbi:MAG: NAD-dependent epimerase/dehydratase family protein [Candidatus Omnitrophota bacterium]
MKTILITGGAGFIGSHLAEAILKVGGRVIVFDNFDYSRFIGPNDYNEFIRSQCSAQSYQCHCIKGDINDKSMIQEAISTWQPDIIVHLAAIADSVFALQFPEMCQQVNVCGVKNVLDACKQCSTLEKFVFVSSSYVYGDFLYDPVDELHPLRPQHIYGITKREGERLTEEFCERYGVAYTIVRPTAVYGFGSRENRVCSKMINDALTDRRIILYNGGNDRLDFTHIDDLINACMTLLTRDSVENEIVNISRGCVRYISELAEIVRMRIPDTHIVHATGDFKRPKRGELDISKMQRLLHFTPRIDLEEGIEMLINEIEHMRGTNDSLVTTMYRG